VVPANADAALISGVKSLYGVTDIDIVKALDAEARREHGVPDPEIPASHRTMPRPAKRFRWSSWMHLPATGLLSSSTRSHSERKP
jgi:hypothetical protein